MATLATVVLNPLFWIVVGFLALLGRVKPTLAQRLLIGLRYHIPTATPGTGTSSASGKAAAGRRDQEGRARNRKKNRGKSAGKGGGDAGGPEKTEEDTCEVAQTLIPSMVLYETFSGIVTLAAVAVFTLFLGELWSFVGWARMEGHKKFDLLLSVSVVGYTWYSQLQILPILATTNKEVERCAQSSIWLCGCALAGLLLSSYEGTLDFRMDMAYLKFMRGVSHILAHNLPSEEWTPRRVFENLPLPPLGVVHVGLALCAAALTFVNLLCAVRVVRCVKGLLKRETKTKRPNDPSSRKNTSRGQGSSASDTTVSILESVKARGPLLLQLAGLFWPFFNLTLWFTPLSSFVKAWLGSVALEGGWWSLLDIFVEDRKRNLLLEQAFLAWKVAMCVGSSVVRMLAFRPQLEAFLLSATSGNETAVKGRKLTAKDSLYHLHATRHCCAVAIQLWAPCVVSLLLALMFKAQTNSSFASLFYVVFPFLADDESLFSSTSEGEFSVLRNEFIVHCLSFFLWWDQVSWCLLVSFAYGPGAHAFREGSLRRANELLQQQ